ncbi:hypothetical protein T484DRAFT_3641134 [Baffinella frigidus]|nr:hypothetical protein T484DRAFT_3641134 [Cryptophyta sp. CCMP2293]
MAIIAIVGLQRGMPSKRESSARVDYVPALCTHRPSLLPIEWSGEVFGSRRRGRFAAPDVNLRKDHCRDPDQNRPRTPIRPAPARSALAVRRRGAIPRVKSTRLSATDISALASMKNVAKCDTWRPQRRTGPKSPGKGRLGG